VLDEIVSRTAVPCHEIRHAFCQAVPGLPAPSPAGDSRRSSRRLSQWERGDELILTSAQCVILTTRSDLEGIVEVEVWLGAEQPTDRPPGHLLFDGELLTTGQGALIGNSTAGELQCIALPTGWHPIRVYTDRPSNPGRFTILLDPNTIPCECEDSSRIRVSIIRRGSSLLDNR
jgi:hypothetical protein